MKSPEFSFKFEVSTDLFRENSSAETFLANLVSKYNTKDYSKVESFAIPLFIFSQGISPLRALVKFLYENRKKSFSEIAEVLARDPRTIWAEYNSVKTQKAFSSKLLSVKTIFVDSKTLANRKFSVLEALSLELISRGYSQKEIANFLNKSPKTIWTVLNRASKKNSFKQSGNQVRQIKGGSKE